MSDKQDSKKVLKKENERTRMNGFVVSIGSVLACAIIFHSGRTDEWGGHYDHSTGEYHYHHGYPAHDHYDIDGDGTVDCPYKFDDNTIHKNPSQNGNNSNNHDSDNAKDTTNDTHDSLEDNKEKSNEKITVKDIAEIILAVALLSFMVYCVIMSVCCLLVLLIETLANKFTKMELKISESDRFTKTLSIAVCVLSIVIATFLMLRDKGVL